ncbi:SPFH domain-containing protein [Roseivirga pacifica]|uniref:SPFH domain-containing protein n=1 Tax=Roseivirga pacifica TaxID=1267423 RepID=UPI003BAA0F17
MTILGIIIIIIGLITLILRPQLNDEDTVKETVGGQVQVVKRKSPPWLLMFTRRVSIAVIITGGLLITLPYLFFWAEPGYQYFVVYPNGKKDAIMTEGIKFRGFAKITPWQKFIDVKVVGAEEDDRDIEGKMDPIPIRFIDQVTATTKLSTRFQLPADKESFIEMAIEFRSLQNLSNNTLIPTVREVVSNTGYMFAAQDYISGSASDFRVAIEEQLKDGAYSVEKTEYRDTVITAIEQENREIKEVQTRYEVKKRVDENGQFIRIPHDINENNIIVAQVIVDDVILEQVFKQRLEAQRDESAKRQLEQQKIKTAKDAQARIIAEGERDKAAERVTQEKEQVKALISIETKLKQEETNKKLAAIALETERLRATAQKVKADAESYQNSKLVQAGLTPQQRAELEKEIAIGVAKEIAKIKFPTTMIIGGEDGGGTPLEALIGATMTKQLTSNGKGN